VTTEDKQARIVSSALWAAAGDALGWVTEVGMAERVRQPVEWRFRPGRFAPAVLLPAGTYSDDTQLRLAVSRATRGNGTFDVEAFAKIELPAWTSYSLGAGRGTTAAAYNLANKEVGWLSNFYGRQDEPDYFAAGGNGAAMRIQPHIWKSDPSRVETYASDVLRDAVVTHGHPRGFCGALFHAFCVAHALENTEAPGAEHWAAFARGLKMIDGLARSDDQLGLSWIGPWQERFGLTLAGAVATEIELAQNILARIGSPADYRDVLTATRGFDAETRGAGLNTAIAAGALAYIGRNQSNEETLMLAANALASDTDTIGSMAGAIIGATHPRLPDWPIQDRDYIVAEAVRMASIASGQTAPTFSYAKGRDGQLGALGPARPVGEPWSGAAEKWQWHKLPCGQTVLMKLG
jgi:ADP-ribosylglycohydrolase